MHTEACIIAGDSISSFAKHINPVDQMNGGLQKKPLKEEEPENDEYLCKTSMGLNITFNNNLTSD